MKNQDLKHTLVYTDYEGGEQFHYVRICLLETERFPHGVATSSRFSDKEKAFAFAQEVDAYLDAALDRPSPADMPTLPTHLLHLICEYGMARTDKANDLEIQHRWETLIAGIKNYAWACQTAAAPDRSSHAKPIGWIAKHKKTGTVLGITFITDEGDKIILDEQWEYAPVVLASDHSPNQEQSSHAELYAALRSMHWNEGKLAVIDARNLKLGVQTYSGEMLDTAIKQAIKASEGGKQRDICNHCQSAFACMKSCRCAITGNEMVNLLATSDRPSNSGN